MLNCIPDGSPIYYPGTTNPVFAVDQPRYLGPTLVASKGTPVRVKFYNFLPAGEGGDLFVPVDETVMGAGRAPWTNSAMNAIQCWMYVPNTAPEPRYPA